MVYDYLEKRLVLSGNQKQMGLFGAVLDDTPECRFAVQFCLQPPNDERIVLPILITLCTVVVAIVFGYNVR